MANECSRAQDSVLRRPELGRRTHLPARTPARGRARADRGRLDDRDSQNGRDEFAAGDRHWFGAAVVGFAHLGDGRPPGSGETRPVHVMHLPHKAAVRGYDHVMPADRTVLEHLLEGRRALVLEAERLTAAIAELDAVIDRIGTIRFDAGAATTAAAPSVSAAGTGGAAAVASGREASRTRRRGRTAAKKSAPKAADGDGGKSIRVRVLDILAAEDRDFSLAEIIDRIHEAGIHPHDDAVRSITIKLMNAGQVERVGRGQYRLSGQGRSANDASEPAGSPEESFTPQLNLAEPWSDGAQA